MEAGACRRERVVEWLAGWRVLRLPDAGATVRLARVARSFGVEELERRQLVLCVERGALVLAADRKRRGATGVREGRL